MADGKFKVISVKSIDDMVVGDEMSPSDYATLTPGGKFVQFEWIEPEETPRAKLSVKPGTFAMQKTMSGMSLVPTEFTRDRVLDGFVETAFIERSVDQFFNKLDVYKELEIENVKRALLITGKPGMGKSTMINKVALRYGADGETMVLVWHTDVFEAGEVKSFIKTFDYEKHGVKRLLLVVEDLGGGTMEGSRMRSDSSLLSLLDNKEKTFSIPVFILATTNNPEMFQENVTNRPERFDEVVKAPPPSAEARVALLRFFAKNYTVETEAEDILRSKKAEGLSPAHIKEVIVRSQIYDKTQVEVINELLAQANNYQKGFADNANRGMGFGG